MNEFYFPDDIGSCPCCRCLVFLVRYVDGSIGLWDPPFVDRRMLVSAIGINAWAEWLEQGQRWGLGYSMHHECPPDELPSPWAAERRDLRIN